MKKRITLKLITAHFNEFYHDIDKLLADLKELNPERYLVFSVDTDQIVAQGGMKDQID